MHLPILKVMGSLVFSFYIYLVLNICTTVDKIITLIIKYLYVYYNRTNIQFHFFEVSVTCVFKFNNLQNNIWYNCAT